MFALCLRLRPSIRGLDSPPSHWVFPPYKSSQTIFPCSLEHQRADLTKLEPCLTSSRHGPSLSVTSFALSLRLRPVGHSSRHIPDEPGVCTIFIQTPLSPPVTPRPQLVWVTPHQPRYIFVRMDAFEFSAPRLVLGFTTKKYIAHIHTHMRKFLSLTARIAAD